MKIGLKILGILGMLMLGGLTVNSAEKIETAKVEALLLTSQEIESDPRWERLRELDPGYPKTLLVFRHFPKDKEFAVLVERSIVKGSEKVTMARLTIHQDGSLWMGETPHVPYFIISARGFLPGEEVDWHFETEDRTFTHVIKLIPNPIKVELPNQDLSGEAILVSLTPAFYRIKLQGIKEGATVNMSSTSGLERLTHSFPWKQGDWIQYSPDVVGKKGGASRLIFALETGEKVQFTLPWGRELLGYIQGEKIYGQD
jgi:hypothetical protein